MLRRTVTIRAAAAGFAALGLVLASVRALRLRWPVLLPVPAAVLLVPLLAPDAYRAFGLALLVVSAGWAVLACPGRRRSTRVATSAIP